MNIYVGNLAYAITETDLRKEFEAFGQVTSAAVIKDKFTGESRGFGFVEMSGRQEALTAMESLNGKDVQGKALKIAEARPRNDNR
jgi:RNA recognition motif-containing protein